MFKRARAGIGYLAQEPSIFRKLTVEENVMAILQMMKIKRARPKGAAGAAAGRAVHQAPAQDPRVRPVRRRAAAAGDHPRAGGQPQVHAAGRAVRGRGPHRRARHPADRERPAPARHRCADLRPQRGADARHRGPRLHHVRRARAGERHGGELVWNEEVAEIYLGPTLTARMRERYPNPSRDGKRPRTRRTAESIAAADARDPQWAADGDAWGVEEAPAVRTSERTISVRTDGGSGDFRVGRWPSAVVGGMDSHDRRIGWISVRQQVRWPLGSEDVRPVADGRSGDRRGLDVRSRGRSGWIIIRRRVRWPVDRRIRPAAEPTDGGGIRGRAPVGGRGRCRAGEGRRRRG